MDAAAWDTRYAAAGQVWSLEPNGFVVEHTAELPPGTALDLAAGEGRNAVWLAARGWRVTAVDFSAVGLDKGRQRDPHDAVEWVRADATTWRPEAGGYDLVLVCYLHLPADERRAALANAAHGVAPGGVLLVIGHDLSNLTDGYGGPPDPAVLYDAGDVVDDLAGSPLRIVTAGSRRRPVSTESGPRSAIDVVVRAERPAVDG